MWEKETESGYSGGRREKSSERAKSVEEREMWKRKREKMEEEENDWF